MPVIVSGGETHTIELDPDGSVTSQLNLTSRSAFDHTRFGLQRANS